MGKGEDTRSAILEAALARASTDGLEGLSIGGLAREVGLSKSGLFAHFRSKEELQRQILQTGVARFVEAVVLPSIERPRGIARLEALLEAWLDWSGGALPGGCLFVAASVELDDRPGPLRDYLAGSQRDWLHTLARAARIAVEEGHLRGDLDPDQLACELHGVLLCHHLRERLLGDRSAVKRSRLAIERLLEDAAARSRGHHPGQRVRARR